MVNKIELTNLELDRLAKEKNMWLATVRNDNRPHLVPLWFLYHNSKIYMCTTEKSVKIRNLKSNSKATVSLEDTFKAFIFECESNLISQPFPREVVEGFKHKFDWDIAKNDSYTVLIELTPFHKIAFNDDR